jgi:hypothetical protein
MSGRGRNPVPPHLYRRQPRSRFVWINFGNGWRCFSGSNFAKRSAC